MGSSEGVEGGFGEEGKGRKIQPEEEDVDVEE